MSKKPTFEKELLKEMFKQQTLIIHQADLSIDKISNEIEKYIFYPGDYNTYTLPELIKCFDQKFANVKDFLLNTFEGWEVAEKFLEIACNGWEVALNYAKKYYQIKPQGNELYIYFDDGTEAKLIRPSYQNYFIPADKA